jgi:hypothetical protein
MRTRLKKLAGMGNIDKYFLQKLQSNWPKAYERNLNLSDKFKNAPNYKTGHVSSDNNDADGQARSPYCAFIFDTLRNKMPNNPQQVNYFGGCNEQGVLQANNLTE